MIAGKASKVIAGMSAETGLAVTGKAHLQQSVSDILTTPIGSRVMRRNYGSHLFDLIDQAANPAGKLRLMAATVDALMRWEPRLKVSRVAVDCDASGAVQIAIEGAVSSSAQENINLTVKVL